jgi:cytochrome c-type biogenesis protein CcmH
VSQPSSFPRNRESGKAKFWVAAFAGMTIMMLAPPVYADSNLPPAYWSDRALPDARQEAQAQALMNELRCLVCQGQSIADSNAELAGDMRDLVRRRIAAGEKSAAIRGWLVQRYGSWISYRPTAEPAAWPLWLAPLALLLIGARMIRRRIRLKAKT